MRQPDNSATNLSLTASQVAGATALFEVAARTGLLTCLAAEGGETVSEAARRNNLKTFFVERVFAALEQAGLAEQTGPGGDRRFRALPALYAGARQGGYASWALCACDVLLREVREFAHSPNAARAAFRRDGGSVARSSALIGEADFYPQQEAAILARHPRRVVDLGAGSATLMIRCLRARGELTAVALDASADACRSGREAAEVAGVAGRLDVETAPIESLLRDARPLRDAEVIHAGFALHDLAAKDDGMLDAVLRSCGEAAPQARLLLTEAVPYAVEPAERTFSAAFSLFHEFMGVTLASEEEWLARLQRAGFETLSVSRLSMPGARLFEARFCS